MYAKEKVRRGLSPTVKFAYSFTRTTLLDGGVSSLSIVDTEPATFPRDHELSWWHHEYAVLYVISTNLTPFWTPTGKQFITFVYSITSASVRFVSSCSILSISFTRPGRVQTKRIFPSFYVHHLILVSCSNLKTQFSTSLLRLQWLNKIIGFRETIKFCDEPRFQPYHSLDRVPKCADLLTNCWTLTLVECCTVAPRVSQSVVRQMNALLWCT